MPLAASCVGAGALVQEVPGGDAPETLHLLGRPVGQENHDICGEYTRDGMIEGRAVYKQVGSNTAISFRQGRWVVDREGVRDSDVVVAYAFDTANGRHPAGAKLMWHVWSSKGNAFVQDSEVFVLEAPTVLTFVGHSSQASQVNGEYRLSGLNEGRPFYRKSDGADAVIRYNALENRWLISAAEHTGSMCSAFAEAQDTMHPGHVHLQWSAYVDNRWGADPHAHCLAAPSAVHVLGRREQAPNSRICGIYHLAGVQEGKPLYVRPGTKAVIRYFPKQERWLIDCDALSEPGVIGRLLQWLQRGEATQPLDACAAFAQANGSLHPGHLDLEWNIWEPQQNRHVPDPCVRATTAPQCLHVSGPPPAAENGDIAGDYVLVGLHMGYPAYQKSNSPMAIRRQQRRWVIDREGLRDSETVVAWADAASSAQHPGDGGSYQWHIFKSSQGAFVVDPAIGVKQAPMMTCGSGDTGALANGKRPATAEEGATAKRVRFDGAEMRPEYGGYHQPGVGPGHASRLGA
eukprot:gb/GFBE01027133.1/.p1 GENE.gb/GFBE01027133.1/~~gb/GFBE01027133.1/.p1  ORF type:complete len:517 (+),score=60.72 gb/GFBE01027133.1/:1-1551(+)